MTLYAGLLETQGEELDDQLSCKQIMDALMSAQRIQQSILLIRKEKVMLDADLVELYGVETKALTRAVKRNIDRFPPDFMFQLTKQEFAHLRCQFDTSSQWGGRRYLPYAFTEQGVAMLSSVLRSKRAVQVNVEIMRIFLQLRKMTADHKALARRLQKLEQKYDKQFSVVFDALRELMQAPESDKYPIEFVHGDKE